MTATEVLELAKEAAESAWDAFHDADDFFGHMPTLAYRGRFPSSSDAFDFVRQYRLDEHEGSEEDIERLSNELHLTPQYEILFRVVYHARLDALCEAAA